MPHQTIARVLSTLSLTALVGGALAAAPAAAEVPPAPPTSVTLAPGGLPAPAQQANGYDLAAHGEALATAATQAVAPGLDLTGYRRLESAGWNRGTILTADLTEPTLSMDLRTSGSVAGVATVREQMAGTGAVAGINGDFFDINASGAPVGTARSHDRLLNLRSGTRPAFQLAGGRALVGALTSSGTLTTPDGAEHALAGFNTPDIPADSIGVYSSLWGDTSLDYAVGSPGHVPADIDRVTVVDGMVTALGNGAGAPDVPDGGQVLLGRGDGAEVVGGLRVGDRVDVEVGLSDDVQLALTGSDQLVEDGVVNPRVSDDGLHARTAIGVDRAGTKVIALTVDGNTTASVGMRRADLATLMHDLGAWEAVNLDGGGSSTMLARVAGTTSPEVVDTPADGSEREVSNSLLFFSTATPTGRTVDAQVRPVSTRRGAYSVLSGLHRTMAGSGLDAAYAAVEDEGRFGVHGGRLALGTRQGARTVVTGRAVGSAEVSFDVGHGRRASAPLRVFGPLDHLGVDRPSLPFADGSGSARLELTGYDADGNAAPVEPQDVTVRAGPGVRVEPDGVDGFRVTPTTGSGSTLVRFEVGGHVAETQVLVGLEDETVADFADGDAWTTASARATGTLTTATGPEGEPALRLRYDFTRSTATRGMYAVPPAPLAVEGNPLELTMWVDGDGSGVWPRIQVTSGDGTVSNLDGPHVTWTGWKQITYPVPTGTAMPLRVDRIRFLETRADTSYHGDLTFSRLVARVAPSGDVPVSEPVHDPVIVTDGSVEDRPQRIAVLSDGQFVARAPDSSLVASVRARLREIVAAHPDRLLVVGDLVDEASPADFALARRILDEEVGDAVPWTYVPGNHEVMGSPLSVFREAFGPTHTSTLLPGPGGGTRVITLDTSALTLHGEGPGQLARFEEELRAAAADPEVTGVLVAMHVPMDDPLPDKASQLTDRIEARELQDRLGRFRTESGKSVAVVDGHVGVFDGSSAQGVSVVVNGNSGKTPAGNAEHGGFVGWTMLGIDPARGLVGPNPRTGARLDWLRAETHPAVDTLDTGAPSTLTVGDTVTVSPTLTQGDTEVPVAWPVSARWSGEHVTTRGPGRGGVLRLDPTTHRLTALRSGTATLVLEVNGTKATTAVTVR